MYCQTTPPGELVNTSNIARTRGSLTLAAVIASLLGTGPAIADDQATTTPGAPVQVSSGIEEVVVTATRREESLQNVAVAVTALTSESLVTRGINTLTDLRPGAVPGLVMNQFAGTPSVLAITIRGVGLSDPSQGTTELTVPVYIDGVFLGRGQGLGLDLIEPERIEILRGPQGQLFGRNAEGGVVQYVSRKPTGEFGIKGSASYGNYEDQRYKLSIDLPKVAGFSAQLSGVMAKHDPFTPQSSVSHYPPPAAAPLPHEDYGLLDSSGFRGAVRWDNGGSFTADYTYDYTDTTDSQPYLTWVPVDIVGRTPFAPVAPSEDYADKTFEQTYNEDFVTKASGHALTLAWVMGDSVTLKSITSYRETSRHGGSLLASALVAGGSSTGLVYPHAHEDLDQNQTSQEFQFLGTWDQFDLTAGAIYYNEEVTDGRRSYLSGPGTTLPALGLGAAFCAGIDPCKTGDTLQHVTTDSYGAYAQANWRPAVFDNRLELTAGARYSDDTKDAKRTHTYNPLSNTIIPVDQPAKFSASRVDPAGTIKYKWTDDLQTYLRYATGYRAGGANVRSSVFSSFKEEENEAWELGMKSQWLDKRLQVNLALFQNTIKGEQLTIQEAPTTNPSLTNTLNSPNDKKIKGAEIELFAAVTENLGLGVNYAYMDVPEYKEYDNPYTPTVVDLTRFYAVATPQDAGSVYLDWGVPLGAGRLAFHADYAWAGDYQATPGAQLVAGFGPTYKRPPANSEQLAARLSWKDIEVASGKLEFALWGKNLTDDAGVIYGFDGCGSGGGFCTYRATPQQYGVEVRFDF
jgi:iron complex outermembrane receptor protein